MYNFFLPQNVRNAPLEWLKYSINDKGKERAPTQ